MNLLLRQNPSVRLKRSDQGTKITFRDSDQVVPLDEVSARIFALCNGEHTLQEVQAMVRREIEHENREPAFSEVFSRNVERLLEENALSVASFAASLH